MKLGFRMVLKYIIVCSTYRSMYAINMQLFQAHYYANLM